MDHTFGIDRLEQPDGEIERVTWKCHERGRCDRQRRRARGLFSQEAGGDFVRTVVPVRAGDRVGPLAVGDLTGDGRDDLAYPEGGMTASMVVLPQGAARSSGLRLSVTRGRRPEM